MIASIRVSYSRAFTPTALLAHSHHSSQPPAAAAARQHITQQQQLEWHYRHLLLLVNIE